MDIASVIRDRLDIKDIVNFYGYQINRSGFIKCPFHSEKTASLKIYSNGKGWYCYGCHSGGSIIDFAMKLFGLEFKKALIKLDEDFKLNLTSNKMSKIEILRMTKEQSRKQALTKIREKEEEKYWNVLKEWKRLDDNKRIYRPKTMDEEIHPFFIEALQKITYQEYLLDMLEVKRCLRK